MCLRYGFISYWYVGVKHERTFESLSYDWDLYPFICILSGRAFTMRLFITFQREAIKTSGNEFLLAMRHAFCPTGYHLISLNTPSNTYSFGLCNDFWQTANEQISVLPVCTSLLTINRTQESWIMWLTGADPNQEHWFGLHTTAGASSDNACTVGIVWVRLD